MSDFNKLPPAEAPWRSVYLGDWGGDRFWPWFLAIRINVARENQITALRGVVQQVAQLRQSKDPGAARLIADFVDELCPRPLVLPPLHGPWPAPPEPHPEWTTNVELLGVLAVNYPAGSVFAEAAFELAKRTLERAQELNKQRTA